MHTPGTRSRQGCLPCRRRHRKCDEGKPTCQLCHKANRTCEYESGLRWASVNHPSRGGPDHAANRAKTKRARSRLQEGSDQDTPGLNTPAGLADRAAAVANDLPFFETFVGDLSSDGLLGNYSTYSSLDTGPSSRGGDAIWNDLLSEEQYIDLLGPSRGPDDSLGFEQSHVQAPLNPCYDLSFPTSRRTTTGTDAALLNAPCADRPRLGTAQQEPSSTGVRLIDQGLGPWLPPTLVSSNEELTLSYCKESPAVPPSASLTDSSSIDISDASARMPAFDGPKNPYRRLSLVAISYPLILHTILYISSVSMKHFGKGDEVAMTNRRAQALMLLHRAGALLESQKATGGGTKGTEHDQTFSVLSLREVALAAHLMHIVAEVMTGSHTAEAYLQDAFGLMMELGYIDHLPQGFYPRFLTQRFAMIDVVLSFLRHRKPLAPKHFVLYQPMDEVDEQEPSFRELTGCPQAVLSFLARISILAARASSGGYAHLAEAYQLESEMRLWGALRYPGPLSGNANLNLLPAITGDRDGGGTRARGVGEMQLDTLSECFYWTAHLLLARRIFLDPTASGRVQMYRRHLFDLMDRLPAGCGPDTSLPFPFYMAAREATSSQDREWVRRKHADMLSHYREQSREVMMSLTEEIWRKNDGDMSTVEAQQSLSPSIWVNDDIYIGVLDSQASHFVF